MIELAGAAMIGDPVDVYPHPRARPVIRLSPGELERLIGVPYGAETVAGVFDRLGFMYERPTEATGDAFLVHAPVWRLDVERPADLVEEVVRIDGYEKIPTTLMRGEPNHRLLSRARLLGTSSTAPRFELVDLGDYPAMVASGNGTVAGELYAVGPATLARLDSFEHHPFLYRRATISLADGSAAEAYLMEALAVAGYPTVASGDWRRR